jgi:hypothetical protein
MARMRNEMSANDNVGASDDTRKAPANKGVDTPSRATLTPEAKRALAEAQARRAAAQANQSPPQEHGGRGGLDPARYGDWEVKGLASDF